MTKSTIERLANLAFRGVADRLLSLPDQRALHIFKYHQILPSVSRLDGGDLPLEIFQWQMEWLKNNMEVFSLQDGLSLLAAGNLPKRAAAITFDDGYAADLVYVVPVLKQFSFSATFFVSSGYLQGQCMWDEALRIMLRETTQQTIDLTGAQLGVYLLDDERVKAIAYATLSKALKYRPIDERHHLLQEISRHAQVQSDGRQLMLSESQVKKLVAEGMEVGSHTVNHPILNCETDSDAEFQIRQDKQQLETLIGRPVKFFAYPNGIPGKDFARQHVDIVRGCGFEAAVTTSPGVVHSSDDVWQLPRFTPWDTSPVKFALRMLRNYRSRSSKV